MKWADMADRLTEVNLTPLGSIVVGALEAKASQVWTFPVPLANERMGSCGVVIWGDDKAIPPTVESLLRYLDLTKDALNASWCVTHGEPSIPCVKCAELSARINEGEPALVPET